MGAPLRLGLSEMVFELFFRIAFIFCSSSTSGCRFEMQINSTYQYDGPFIFLWVRTNFVINIALFTECVSRSPSVVVALLALSRTFIYVKRVSYSKSRKKAVSYNKSRKKANSKVKLFCSLLTQISCRNTRDLMQARINLSLELILKRVCLTCNKSVIQLNSV